MGTAPVFVGFDGKSVKISINANHALMRFVGVFDTSLLPVEICAKWHVLKDHIVKIL
jgi:hypothetical protein